MSAEPHLTFTRADCDLLQEIEAAHVTNDLAAIIAYQDDELTIANAKIADLERRLGVAYEDARHDADARLELAESLAETIYRESDGIDTRDRSGEEVTLDALIDIDLPHAFGQVAWAVAQVLKTPHCNAERWLRDIRRCFGCARNGHRCDAKPCGYHHDDGHCARCDHAAAMDKAEAKRDEERES